MFNKNKIILNHVRASKTRHHKSNLFLREISKEIVDRAEISGNKNYRVLDLWARGDHIYDLLLKNNPYIDYYQTLSDNRIKTKARKKIVSAICPPFPEDKFDFCFSMFSIYCANNILDSFKTINNLLKKNGKFICVFHAEDNLIELKKYFFEFFPQGNRKSFLPFIDILSLGKIGKESGFNNIVIDKNNFYLKVQKPFEIWNFIRNIGESNILNSRKDIFLQKEKYLSFYKKISDDMKRSRSTTTLSLNFFIGTK